MKISVVAVVVLIVIGWYSQIDSSKQYWEAVGPRWDRMFNPCKYGDCEK